MKNKYLNQLIASTILFAFASILFYGFTISPIIAFLTNTANEGHLLVIITAPISTIFFLFSLCFFIISLVKYSQNENKKK